ncbi:MAG: DedA family protein [Geminicoccaceae bacterium]|nr:DedA family protein [Geminicoccaceae bacterium]
MEQSGYLGIALLMFAENLFPPIPSEVIMPLAGFSAGEGKLDIALVVVAGSVGSLAGALLWYYIGRWIGRERLRRFASRYGRFLTVEPRELDSAFAWFGEHGSKAVFFGRLVPAIRTLISVPAGICAMPMIRFLIWSGLGTVIWTGALAAAGYLLGEQHQKVAAWMNPISYGVIGLLVLVYLYRVVTFDPAPERHRR